MQDEQKKFQEKLSELLSYARNHENKVTMKEVRDFFEDFALDEQKVTFVCEYLTMEQVDVADYEPGVVPEETEKEKKKPEFSEEELRALQQYLDELPETETPSEEETAELYRKAAEGDYLLLLNNDVEVVNGDWLTELLRQCAHPGGAAICGAMLWYPDETIQHAGIVTGLGGYAGHSHKYKKKGGSGYLFRTSTVQDFSGVTGACLLVKTAVYDEMHGLDEQFAVAFNDVDFCLRVRDAGYRIAWTPYAQLTHYESKSRGGDEKDPVKAARFAAEQQRLYDIHGKADILDDPYYNPSLTHDREDFSESGDLRNLKEGKVTVRWRNA